MQRTIEVEHPGAHEPTIEQLRAAVVSTLKDEGLKLNGSYTAKLKSQTSGQSSKYLIDFEADEVPAPKRAARKSEPVKGSDIAPVGIEDVAHEDLT